MSVDRDDFRIAAALCTTELDRVYHLLMMLGLDEHAVMVREVDKGKLVSRIVTRGCNSDGYSPGELFLLVLVCVREAGCVGITAAEIRGALREAHGDLAMHELMQRMRAKAKP